MTFPYVSGDNPVTLNHSPYGVSEKERQRLHLHSMRNPPHRCPVTVLTSASRGDLFATCLLSAVSILHQALTGGSSRAFVHLHPSSHIMWVGSSFLGCSLCIEAGLSCLPLSDL